MRKLYLHSDVCYRDNKWVCSRCGLEVGDVLLHESPCAIPTAYYTELDESGYMWVINVYDCRARLLPCRAHKDAIVFEEIEINDRYLEEQLENIMLADIEEQGER